MRLRLLVILLLVPSACHSPSPSTAGEERLPDGARLAWRMRGQGPDTLVVVPGGPGLGTAYLEEGLVPLAARHAVLFLDPRGRGRSTRAAGDSLSVAGDIADLLAALDRLRIGRAVLVAHHAGAVVAARLAEEHPERVSRLVLLAPIPPDYHDIFALSRLPHDSLALARNAAALLARRDSLDPAGYCREFWGFLFSPVQVTGRDVTRRLAPAICADAPDRLRERPAIQRRLLASLGAWELRPGLANVHAPALVIVGSDADPLARVGHAWARFVRHGGMLVVSAPGLFPWLGDARGLVNGVERFLAGAWPPEAWRPGPWARPVSGP